MGANAHPENRARTAREAARPLPMLWRVFAVNAAIFALAFALLALAPMTIHASTRLEELVLLLAGLVVMLVSDLLLVRRALRPLDRLSKVMGQVDLLRPGQRAVGFEESSSEVLALAQAFNFDGVMTKQRMSPSVMGTVAAILGKCLADGFVRTKRVPEVLGGGQGAENEDPVKQSFGNPGSCVV